MAFDFGADEDFPILSVEFQTSMSDVVLYGLRPHWFRILLYPFQIAQEQCQLHHPARKTVGIHPKHLANIDKSIVEEPGVGVGFFHEFLLINFVGDGLMQGQEL